MAELQSRVVERMHRKKPMLTRAFIPIVSTVIPLQLIAWFAERYIKTEAALRLASDLPPSRAASIVDHLSTEYLLELIQQIEPLEISSLLYHINPSTTARIAKVLADERSFADMSRLVGFLAPESMISAVRVLHSGDDLLKVALHVEDKKLLSPAIASLPTKKLPGLFSAAEKGGHWEEVFGIVDVMDPATQRQLGERLSDLNSSDMTAFLHAALQLNTWPQLLQICLDLSEYARARLANNIAMQEESLHLKFMQAAQQQGQMQTLLKLVSLMPMPDQRRLVRMAGRHGIRITSVL